jgi:SPP1 family predicted phage head-tail adaptor
MAETRTAFLGGCYTTSWTTSSTEWANCQQQIQRQVTNESEEFQKKQQFTSWKIITRYNSNITNAKKIIYGSRTLLIQTVTDPVGRNRMIEITCREENT